MPTQINIINVEVSLFNPRLSRIVTKGLKIKAIRSETTNTIIISESR
jgi:hypothetical protein